MAPSLTDSKHREQPLAPHLRAERFWSAEWRGLEPRGRSHGQPAFGALRHAWAAPASKGKRDPLTGVGVRRSEAVHAILGAPAAHGVPHIDYAAAATAKRSQGYSVRNSITRHAVRACPTLADRNAITGRGVEYFVVVEARARARRARAPRAASLSRAPRSRPLLFSSSERAHPRESPPLLIVLPSAHPTPHPALLPQAGSSRHARAPPPSSASRRVARDSIADVAADRPRLWRTEQTPPPVSDYCFDWTRDDYDEFDPVPVPAAAQKPLKPQKAAAAQRRACKRMSAAGRKQPRERDSWDPQS